jgi:hypothetical protein
LPSINWTANCLHVFAAAIVSLFSFKRGPHETAN